jgi:hypothetical protein
MRRKPRMAAGVRAVLGVRERNKNKKKAYLEAIIRTANDKPRVWAKPLTKWIKGYKKRR